MNRPVEPTVEELMVRIAALQAENRQLTERVVKLEEELALARLHRFAPKSVNGGVKSGQCGGVKPGHWLGCGADMKMAPIGAIFMSAAVILIRM